MKKILYLLLLISTPGIAQSKFNLLATIETEADFFTTDNQGNVYLVKKNELTKYDKTGRRLYKYSDKKWGNISFVDASNMLNLLVYYRDFLQVVFLDNTLSLNGEAVSLDKIGFQQAQLVCSSHNSSIWLYDQQNFELIRLNQALEKKQQTGNLNLLLNASLQPNMLLENDNRVYLNNPSSGILIFDIYGTYYKTIPLKNLTRFQPKGDWIYFTSDNKAKAYNIKTTEEKLFETPLNDFKNFRLEMGILVLQTEKSLIIYTAE